MSSPLSPEKWSEVLGVSDEIAQRLTAKEQAETVQKKAIEALVPGVVQELVKYACIDTVQSDEVSSILADHSRTLELVKKLAAKQATPEPLGVPVDPKGAASMSKSANHSSRNGADFLDSPAATALLEKSRMWRQS